MQFSSLGTLADYGSRFIFLIGKMSNIIQPSILSSHLLNFLWSSCNSWQEKTHCHHWFSETEHLNFQLQKFNIILLHGIQPESFKTLLLIGKFGICVSLCLCRKPCLLHQPSQLDHAQFAPNMTYPCPILGTATQQNRQIVMYSKKLASPSPRMGWENSIGLMLLW